MEDHIRSGAHKSSLPKQATCQSVKCKPLDFRKSSQPKFISKQPLN